MIMNMNEKGRQTKLLAAIAVLAMVLCAFAIAIPADAEGNTYAPSVPTGDNVVIVDDVSKLAVIEAGKSYVINEGTNLTINSPITVDQDVGIYLNGGTITFAQGGSLALTGASGTTAATLYVISGSIVGATSEASGNAGNITVGTNSAIKFYGGSMQIDGVDLIGSNGMLNASNGELTLSIDSTTFGMKYTVSKGTVTIDGAKGYEGIWMNDTMTVASGATLSVVSNLSVSSPSFTNSGKVTVVSGSAIILEGAGQGTITNSANAIISGAVKSDGEGAVSLNNVKAGTNGFTLTYGYGISDSDPNYILINGDVASGSVTVTFSNVHTTGLTLGTDAELQAVSSADIAGSATLYSSISSKVSLGSNMILYGDYEEDISLSKAYNIYIADNSSYNGTVSFETPASGSNPVFSTSVSVIANGDGTYRNTTIQVDSDGNIDVIGHVVNAGTTADGKNLAVNSSMTLLGATSTFTGGDNTTEAKTISIDGVAIGSMTLGVELTLDAGKVAVIPEGSNVVFQGNGSISLADETSLLFVLGGLSAKQGDSLDSPIFGDKDTQANWGTVYATNTTATALYANKNVNVDEISTGSQRISVDINDNAAAIQTLKSLPAGSKVELTTTGNTTLKITDELSLSNLDITISDGKNITIQIGDGTQNGAASVSLTEVTLDRGTGNTSTIVVKTGSNLTITDSLLFIVVDAETGSSVDVDNAGVVYENTSSDVKVGYGTSLTLTGNVTSIVDVYGNLVIDSTASVPAGTQMTVYKGGSLVVNGTLTILGEAQFDQGSKTEINGTVTVGEYKTGGAVLDIDGDFTVNADATVNISSVQADNRNKNQLQAPDTPYNNGYDYEFIVIGTLNMNGTMSGYVHNQGTVAINGTSNNATVVVYDGVSMTVTSVTNTLNVKDKGICDDMIVEGSGMMSSDGNSVSFTNVRNVTVSVDVNVLNYTVGNSNHRDFQAVMSLSGDVTSAGNGNISVLTATLNEVGKDDVCGYVTVPADAALNFGANVDLTVNNPFIVNGTIDYFKAQTNDDKVPMGGAGPMTVNGTVEVTQGYMGIANVNAVMYTVTVTGNPTTVTETYTNFVAAVNAALDADEDRIVVMGSVNAESVDVATGVIIDMQNNATITVVEDATVVLTDGATLNGSATNSIEVKGTFTSQNYEEDLNISQDRIYSDVIIKEDPSRTWTSFANALESGMTQIELNRDIEITEDTTIPEGTTVTTVYSVTVYNDATLSIDGTLAMTPGNGKLLSLANPDDEEDTGAITVDGVLSVRYLNSNASVAAMTSADGVYFKVKDGAYTTAYMANMAFAAETVSANSANLVYIDANSTYNVQVIGSVGAGDVTFAAADNAVIAIMMNSAVEGNVLTMGTLTMTGAVSLSVQNAAEFNGTVSGPTGTDGTAQAVFDGASGFVISAGHDISVDGNDYYTAISGSISGDVTIASGNVEIRSQSGLIVNTGASVSIATGATLTLDGTLYLDDKDTYDTVPMTVEGTLQVNGVFSVVEGTTGTFMEIPGTLVMDNRNASIPAAVDVYVTGTLQVGEDDTLDLYGKVVIGSAPDSLGVGGVMAGDYDLNGNAYIIAYAGADLTGATIEWNIALDRSDAKSTTYHINGVEYATVYTAGSIQIGNVFGDDREPIDLTGLDKNNNWYAAEDYSGDIVNTQSIGRYTDVYANFQISEEDVTISKDAGIILTIDGKIVVPTDGYGDQSFTTNYPLSVGTHVISWSERTGYDISGVTVTFNGVEIENGATITIEPDSIDNMIVASGAVPSTGGDTGSTGGDDGMGLTDYLLIVLVVLIIVMAIIVAIRLMRS